MVACINFRINRKREAPIFPVLKKPDSTLISHLADTRKFVESFEEERLVEKIEKEQKIAAIKQALEINEKFGFDREIIKSLRVIFFRLAKIQNNSQSDELEVLKGWQDSPNITLKNLRKTRLEIEFLQRFPRNYVESRKYPNEKKVAKLCKYFLLCQLILRQDYDQEIKISCLGFKEKFENFYDYYSQFLKDPELAPIILAYLKPYFAHIRTEIVENKKLRFFIGTLIKTTTNSLLAAKITKQNQIQQHQNEVLPLTVFFDNKIKNYSFLQNYDSQKNEIKDLIYQTILEMNSRYYIFLT